MSSVKRRRLSSKEILDFLDADYDMLYLESSSSESSHDSDENTYSSSDADIFPNDWTSNSK